MIGSRFIYCALSLFLCLSGCAFNRPHLDFKINPETQLVVGRYKTNENAWHSYLTRIDLKTNKILLETPLFGNPAGDISELSDGTVAFSYLRAPGTVQHKVGLIDATGRYRNVRTTNDDASFILGYLNRVTIWSGANYDTGEFIEWMDSKGKGRSKQTIEIHSQAMTRRESITFDSKNHLYLICIRSYLRNHVVGLAPFSPYGILIRIDPYTHSFSKQEWPYYWTDPALCIIPSQKALLVAPNIDGRYPVDTPEHVTHQIDFVTYPGFKLIQSIQLPGMAWEITYAPVQKKAYVRVQNALGNQKSGIAVIDVPTKKMVRFLEMPCSSIRYVGLNRLAVCTWDQRKEITKDPREACSNYRLLLFDTQTDKVVATFPGQYDRIGHDSEIETAAY